MIEDRAEIKKDQRINGSIFIARFFLYNSEGRDFRGRVCAGWYIEEEADALNVLKKRVSYFKKREGEEEENTPHIKCIMQ